MPINRIPGELFAAGLAHQQQTERAHLEESLAEALDSLRANLADLDARFTAATCLAQLGRQEESIPLLEAGIGHADPPHLHMRLIGALEQCNLTEEAVQAARRALARFPDRLIFRFKELLLLPVLYHSEAELSRYRARFIEGVARLAIEVPLDTEAARRNAVAALNDHSNVFFAYQGFNDRDVLVQWGDFVHRVMTASFPEWMQPLSMPPVHDSEPLRIGFVSSRFHDGSACRFFLGWLRERHHDNIAIHSWYVGFRPDAVTEEVRQLSDRFDHFPDQFEPAVRSIRERNLHALISLDVGIEPLTTMLAALRLAPIQCRAWDHPVTTGLPNVAFALTSALSEPPGAAAHYSEQLVSLPGIGVCYPKPIIPVPLLRKTRADFHLGPDAIVYLCCQSIFKFLPGADPAFAQIARAVPAARFVFTSPNRSLTRDLFTRLRPVFAAEGLSADDFIVALPHLNHFDYWNLQLLGDVFLDTIEWSSAGSVMEAIACRLPVVTLEGQTMRARQGAAILTQLGTPDTIARNLSEWISIAIELGLNPARRSALAEITQHNWSRLFSDPASISALEDFLRHAVISHRTR